MTRIYFVRHCEAYGNVLRIFQGVTDTDITQIGEKQLLELKKRFWDIELDKIYTSPLIRTRKTAEAIKGTKSTKIEILPELIELNGGFVEGKPFKETFDAHPDLKEIWYNHPQDFAPEGGESMQNAYKRTEKMFFDIVNANKGKTVACSSHGGVIRCLLCRALYNDINQLKEVGWLDNTAVSLFEVDDNMNITVKFSNDFSHLPAELLPQNNRISSFM